MFKFGKSKTAGADVAQESAPNSESLLSPEAKEALAIGGGKIKAVAETVEAARDRLKAIDAAQLPTVPHQIAGGAAKTDQMQSIAAITIQKAAGMTNPSSQDKTTSGANGNGANATGGDKQNLGGSPFTEPTPGGKEKTVATLFGEIVWLFSQSPKHKNFFVSDLEWLVMTPVLLRQFRVFYAPDRPIGVALWAYVNEEVEQRLKSGNARLAPTDWKSGDKLWLVDIVAPYGGHDAMIEDLKEKVFPEREIAFLGVEDGKAVAKTV